MGIFGDIFTDLDRFVTDSSFDPVAFTEAVWPKEPPIFVPRDPIKLIPVPVERKNEHG